MFLKFSDKFLPYFVFTLSLCFFTAVFFCSLFFSKKTALPVTAPVQTPKTVILDAGHGGEDPGAIGKNGVYEKDLNLSIAKELGSQLEDLGYSVVYTRTDDRLLYREEENIKGLRKIYDLKNRVGIALKYENAIFISIHMNAFSDEKYSGLQVLYSETDPKSLQLAENIQDEVKEKLQTENRRSVKSGNGLYLMDHIDYPAVLIECGFLSNTRECEKLCEKEYQKQLCFSILCGIISYIEE